MIGIDVCQHGILELDLLSNGLTIDAQISCPPTWVIQYRDCSLIVAPKVEKDVIR